MPKIENKLPKTLRTVTLSQLQPFQGNIKHIEPDNLARLIESIKRLGFIMPVFLWQGNILDGHQRKIALEALEADGWTLDGGVPVIDIEAKDEREAKTMLLTYVSQYADVVRDELADWVKEAGISALELDAFVNLPLDIPMADEVKPDDYELDAKMEPRAKPGEIWQLGEHRLFVGDATQQESWDKLLAGERAQMVFTDPPYNVDYHSDSKALTKGGKASIKNDKMDEAAFRAFLTAWAVAMRPNLKEDAGVYICYAIMKHIEFEQSVEAAGFAMKAQIIWVKNIASMGWGDYRWRHEPIMYCSIGGKSAYFDGERIHTTVTGDKEGSMQFVEGGGYFAEPRRKPLRNRGKGFENQACGGRENHDMAREARDRIRTPYTKTDRAREAGNPQLLSKGGYCRGFLRRKRQHAHHLREDRETLRHHGARPGVCEYHH